MGSVTYDFLADSLFFHKGSLETKFKNVSNKRIEKELEDYRNHCLKNYSILIKEIQEKRSSLKVFSSMEKMQYSLLKQTALYVDQFIVFDPIFKLTDFTNEITTITGKYLGYQQESGINKQELWRASNFLKDITPMVAYNYVKIFPLSYLFETSPQIPLNLPIDYYNGVLPKPVMDYFWKNAQVRSMKKSSDGNGWMVDENKLYPCRGVVIDFKDTDYLNSYIYHLFETEVIDFDEKTRLATFRQTLPDTLPNRDYFNAWITQSINSSAKMYFDKVYQETLIASNLNSTYLSDNLFTNELLSTNYKTKESISANTATQVMNMELPFLNNIDTEELMKVRHYEEDIFTNFRLELEKNFRDLKSEKDEKVLKEKIESILHELNEVQGHKIKMKINQVNRRLRTNTSIGIAGLMGSFQTGGLSLIATAIAAGKGIKDYYKDIELLENNPSYFLWKIQQK
jgi:hypothetical protein